MSIAAAWGDSPKGSYLNTFNPLSQLIGGTDRIPEWWVKGFFPNTEGGHRAAHITFKAGADAILAAALIAGYRGINYANRMAELQKSDNPANGMKSQLSTTFAGSLEPKKKKKQQQKKEASVNELRTPDIISWGNTLSSSIPLGAVLIATSLAYKGADDYFDKKRNKALDVAIANKETVLKRLMKTRSRLAKGNASDREVLGALNGMSDDDLYVKEASQTKKADLGDAWDTGREAVRITTSGLATLSCLILGAAAVGSYAYFSKGNENNIRYRAMKDGLKEYARVKSGYTPVNIIPTKSQNFFSSIDEPSAAAPKEKAKKKEAEETAASSGAVRNEPSLLTDTYNKPISLTL